MRVLIRRFWLDISRKMKCEFDTTKLVKMYIKADFMGKIPAGRL